jgi:predicted transcriptional regulator
MSVTEILEELPKLSPTDQGLIRERIDELQMEDFEETPEMLAAIDEGIRSAENEESYPVEVVRAELSSWITKSS